MKDIIPATKQSPILGLSGMGGGVGGNLGGSLAEKTYMDDVFSTYLWRGNSTDNRAINVGFDYTSEEGLVWIKNRQDSDPHCLFDTLRGANKRLASNDNSGWSVSLNGDGNKVAVGALNSNGGTGNVMVYESNGSWWASTATINGEVGGGLAGHHVSFSSDGKIDYYFKNY